MIRFYNNSGIKAEKDAAVANCVLLLQRFTTGIKSSD